jgi:hypothetical protein
MKRRSWILLLALAATLSAVALVPEGTPPLVENTRPRPNGTNQFASPERTSSATAGTSSRAETASRPPLVATLRDRSADEPSSEPLFASRSWRPIPTQPMPSVQASSVAPVAPPAPSVPPIPFRFVGRFEEGTEQAVFLEFQQQTVLARAGDTLAGGWKVELVEPTRMVLIYEPMNEKRTLEWTSAP